jgi:hypothetical protein
MIRLVVCVVTAAALLLAVAGYRQTIGQPSEAEATENPSTTSRGVVVDQGQSTPPGPEPAGKTSPTSEARPAAKVSATESSPAKGADKTPPAEKAGDAGKKEAAEEEPLLLDDEPPLLLDDEPPLLLDDEPPLLLDDGEAEGCGPMADNSRCHVCHLHLAQEDVAVVHARANVGCTKCHGDCDAHIADESWASGGTGTPPGIMYPRAKIDAACGQCHEEHDVAPTKVIQCWLDRYPDHEVPKAVVCTDCHGHHHVDTGLRKAWWDKATGQPIKPEKPADSGKTIETGNTIE